MRTFPTMRSARLLLGTVILIVGALAGSPHDGLAEPDESSEGVWRLFETVGLRRLIQQAAAYDSSGDRLLLFGGNDFWTYPEFTNEVFELTLAGTPRASAIHAAGLAPPERADHAMVFDPVGQRLIVIGGRGARTLLQDVWTLSLGALPTWTRLIAAGTPPRPMATHSAIYDPLRRRVIVFAGQTAEEPANNELWALELDPAPRWSRLTPAGNEPSPRAGQTAIYDPVRDRMVIFGGYTDRHALRPLDEVWALSLSGTPTWHFLHPAGGGPPPTSMHTAVYARAGDRMLVFGGQRNTYPFNLDSDVWSFSLDGTNRWTRLDVPPPLPAARTSFAAVYDLHRDRLVISGGHPLDTWALDLSAFPSWSQISVLGQVGPRLTQHAAAYDSSRGRLLVYGGMEEIGAVKGDVWELVLDDVARWHRMPVLEGGPGPRSGASAILDPAADRLIVFGGLPSTANDAWVLPLAQASAWLRLAASGLPPPARTEHCALHDPLRNRMLVLGGMDPGGTLYGDTWELSLGANPAWTRLNVGAFTPQRSASAVYDPLRDRVILIGAGSTPGALSAWELRLAAPSNWTPLTPSGAAPMERQDHSAIYDPLRDRVVIFGGGDQNDTWSLELTPSPHWRRLQPSGTLPRPRSGHIAFYERTADRMVVYESRTCCTDPDDIFTLTWGSGAVPEVRCPGDIPARTGDLVTAYYEIVNHQPSTEAYDITLTSSSPLPGFPLTGRALVPGNTSAPVSIAIPFQPGGSSTSVELEFSATSNEDAGLSASCRHRIGDSPSEALASLRSADVLAGAVRLEWIAERARLRSVGILRRQEGSTWEELGPGTWDGAERLVYLDTRVEPDPPLRLPPEGGDGELRGASRRDLGPDPWSPPLARGGKAQPHGA